MTYIPYIYVTKNNGFVDNVKFMQELDVSKIKPGDNITVYYNETYPFYNAPVKNEDNSYTLFQNDCLVTYSQENFQDKINELFPQLLNQVASSNIGDLLNDYTSLGGKENNSLFKDYLQNIEYKINTKFEPQVGEFSLETYKKITNQLVIFCDCLDNIKLSHFIKSSIRAFNTFLGYEGIISDFSGGSFKTNFNEQANVEEIYFGDAASTLHYAEERCEYNLKLKADVKKLKM